MTNDDGFFSKGIDILYRKLNDLGQIYIVAPDQERSASSLSLSLHHPLRLKTIQKNIYAVSGTPTDCVYMAVQKLLPKKPDLLISGLNLGPNLGQQDILYSGTVAGALQGTFLQVPSVAISLKPDEQGQFSFDLSARIVYRIALYVLTNGLPEGITLNINIPPPPIKGVKIVKLGQKRYNPEIILKTDPRRRTYYWIGTGNPEAVGDADSDVMIFKKGYMTITPLHSDLTAHNTIESASIHNILSAVKNEIF